jgi:rare lipoprotein A
MSSPVLRITSLAAALALASVAPAAAQEPAPPTGGVEASLGQPGLTVSPGALLDRTLAIRGQVGAGDAGRAVRIERQVLDGSWQPIAATIVEATGAFRAAWKTDQLGRVAIRALVERDGAATAAAVPLTAQLTVFQPATASWYGPGFFGRRTACGVKLTKKTVGVAHRTLPCGTRVELYHRGKTLTVPVIDRGPFKKGRDWDLTHAAAQQLGVKATVRVGVLAPTLPPSAAAPAPAAPAK